MTQPISPRVCRTALLLIIACQTLLLVVQAIRTSPTANEPAHFAAGFWHWKYHDFSPYRVNPPLVRLLATAPAVIASDLRPPLRGYADRVGTRPVFAMGRVMMADQPRSMARWILVGRLVLMPIIVSGTVLMYWFAKRLYRFGTADDYRGGGPRDGLGTDAADLAGVIAAGLYAFSPTLIGHGALMTPDAVATVAGVFALSTFWTWLRRPTWRETLVSGLALGLAESCKTTLVVYLPLWPVVWMADRVIRPAGRRPGWGRREAAMLAARFLVALNVFSLAYFGSGLGRPLGRFEFVSELFTGLRQPFHSGNRFSETILAGLPMPVSEDFVLGLNSQQADFEDYMWPSYLRGQWSDEGWLSYYFQAALMKSPVGTLLLISAALPAAVWAIRNSGGRSRRNRLIAAAFVLLPGGLIWGIASLKMGINLHYRYVLPALPMFFLFTAVVLAWCYDEAARYGHASAMLVRRLTILAGLLVPLECLSAHPRHIGFFNVLVGGPASGAEWLLGSNVDWGQGLYELRNHVAATDDVQTPVFVAVDCGYDPVSFLGEPFEVWPLFDGGGCPPRIPAGTYAVGINLLKDFPAPIVDGDGKMSLADRRLFRVLEDETPRAVVGNVHLFDRGQVVTAYESMGCGGEPCLD